MKTVKIGEILAIDVKQSHIDNGEACNPHKCMMSTAVKELNPAWSYVDFRVDGATVTTRKPNGGSVREYFELSEDTRLRVQSFDIRNPDGTLQSPISPFKAKLVKIGEHYLSPVMKAKTLANAERTAKRRAELKAAGLTVPSYSKRQREAGRIVTAPMFRNGVEIQVKTTTRIKS